MSNLCGSQRATAVRSFGAVSSALKPIAVTPICESPENRTRRLMRCRVAYVCREAGFSPARLVTDRYRSTRHRAWGRKLAQLVRFVGLDMFGRSRRTRIGSCYLSFWWHAFEAQRCRAWVRVVFCRTAAYSRSCDCVRPAVSSSLLQPR